MNAQATSHRHFHDELSELKVALLNMSGEAQAALASAVDAVLQRDGDKARDVIAGDREIGRSPECAREAPSVARTPKDVACLRQESLRGVEVGRAQRKREMHVAVGAPGCELQREIG